MSFRLPFINPLSSAVEWARYLFDLTRFDEALLTVLLLRHLNTHNAVIVAACDVSLWVTCCGIWAMCYRARCR